MTSSRSSPLIGGDLKRFSQWLQCIRPHWLPQIFDKRVSRAKKSCGGEGEIRTLGTREGSTVFETAAIDHSATSPRGITILPFLPGPRPTAESYIVKRCCKTVTGCAMATKTGTIEPSGLLVAQEAVFS